MNSNNIALYAALMAAGCCACAPLPGSQDVDRHNGARRGSVAAFYDAAAPAASLPPCLAGKSAAELASHRYARVEYRHVRMILSEVAELPDGQLLGLGDQVEIWPRKCAQGELSRISKVLPAPAR